MNWTLYRNMLYAHARSILSYSVGSALYLWLIIGAYPSVQKVYNNSDNLLKMLPKGMLKAFGISKGMETLEGFVSGEFYGLLFLIILSIFSIMTSTQLVAKLVDRGGMAYLLSSPTSRIQVACTQAIVLITGLLLICAMTIIGGFSGTALFLDNVKIHASHFIQLNLMGFLLFLVISGYSFFFSCLFNDEKHALGASTALTLLFYIVDLASKLTDQLQSLGHFSIFSLYRAQEIAYGNEAVLAKAIGLGAAGVVLFIAGILVFRKKDLII